jgi:aryl-alcohol dehydrogenase-like predicted oxidoreductase
MPIPGAGSIDYLDDNLPAADLELTDDDIREIDHAFATLDVKGAPLSDALNAAVDR